VSLVRLDCADGVAWLTLARADAENRFSFALMNEFIEALEEASDGRSHVLVLRAEGPNFTLGREMGETVAGVSRTENLSRILRANELLQSFPGVRVALVQGRAMGFGTGLVLHSDIAIGADDAVLGFDELKHGLPPLVVVAYLAQHVTARRATELVITGRDVPAQEALQLGMFSRVVPRDRLAAEGDVIVAELAARDGSALRLIHAFGRDLAAGTLEDPGADAVRRLVGWIESR
jgi:enoyl-CoA hydratase/carnithine racemase